MFNYLISLSYSYWPAESVCIHDGRNALDLSIVASIRFYSAISCFALREFSFFFWGGGFGCVLKTQNLINLQETAINLLYHVLINNIN